MTDPHAIAAMEAYAAEALAAERADMPTIRERSAQWAAAHAAQEAIIVRTQQERDAALSVLSALVAKVDECQLHIEDACLHRELRCGPYTRPQYGEALDAARAAVAAVGAG